VKNHPIYLFSYIHNPIIDGALGTERVATVQVTALNTYCGDWVTGFSDGASTYHRAGPNGAVAQSGAVEEYVTHRDFRK
jgi:hypothetical protein